MLNRCPACGAAAGEEVYRAGELPANSVRLFRDRGEARAIPRGDMRLVRCDRCGLMWNRAFDPSLVIYDPDYEETQGHSAVFRAFHDGLAAELVDRLRLASGTVVEIGCGKGEFLELMLRHGAGRGIGFDPSWRPGSVVDGARLDFRVETFPPAAPVPAADLYCCKMTLEHVADARAFVGAIAAHARRDRARVFLMVPDAGRILSASAFWDVYYEHCLYFTATALEGLVRRSGLAVLETRAMYDGQYLGLLAAPANGDEPEAAALPAAIGSDLAGNARRWRQWLSAGRRVALWGGGSKAVALVSALPSAAPIVAVVDINPRKQGCFLPGSGLEVSAPSALTACRPDAVLAMNPVYREEISASLREMGLDLPLLCLEDGPPAD